MKVRRCRGEALGDGPVFIHNIPGRIVVRVDRFGNCQSPDSVKSYFEVIECGVVGAARLPTGHFCHVKVVAFAVSKSARTDLSRESFRP